MSHSLDSTDATWLKEVAALDRSYVAREPPPDKHLLGGRFRVGRALGRGGMGAVYEAFDAQRGQRVALKTLTRLRPEHLFSLKNEFRALSDVSHPNLVSLHGLYCDADFWFLTMDYVPGVTLRDALAAGGEVHALFGQLAAGIAALHDAARLHRDLKPSNVMVTPDGHLTIVDFGLSRDTASDAACAGAERFWGTPAYMAPELRRGEPAGIPAEWYAFGVMLREALARQRADAPLEPLRALLRRDRGRHRAHLAGRVLRRP